MLRFRLLEYRMGVRRQRDREAFEELDALMDSYLIEVRMSTYVNLQFLSLAGNRLDVASLKASGIDTLKKLRMLDLADNFIGAVVGEKKGLWCVRGRGVADPMDRALLWPGMGVWMADPAAILAPTGTCRSWPTRCRRWKC